MSALQNLALHIDELLLRPENMAAARQLAEACLDDAEQGHVDALQFPTNPKDSYDWTPDTIHRERGVEETPVLTPAQIALALAAFHDVHCCTVEKVIAVPADAPAFDEEGGVTNAYRRAVRWAAITDRVRNLGEYALPWFRLLLPHFEQSLPASSNPTGAAKREKGARPAKKSDGGPRWVSVITHHPGTPPRQVNLATCHEVGLAVRPSTPAEMWPRLYGDWLAERLTRGTPLQLWKGAENYFAIEHGGSTGHYINLAQLGDLQGGTPTTTTTTQPPPIRNDVFVSYSHKDKRWLEEFLTHLKPYLRDGSVTAWSDKQILPGSKWFDEIRLALSKTKVAVLLVTPDFLASDFIHQQELSPLLKEAEAGGVRILWIPVRASSYQKSGLRAYQAIIPPGRPLAKMKADRDGAWVEICQTIEEAVKSKPPARGPVHFKSHDVFFRFKGTDAAGVSVSTKKEAASYVTYWFVLDVFNTRTESVGMMDFLLVFTKGDQVLLEVIPTQHTGETRFGMLHCPDLTCLTVPSNQWLTQTFEGAVQADQTAIIKDCDEIHLKAASVDGDAFKVLLTRRILEA